LTTLQSLDWVLIKGSLTGMDDWQKSRLKIWAKK